MLSPRELGHLGRVKRLDTPQAFLDEQALLVRASKSQQLRLYGYWRRGPVVDASLSTIQADTCERYHDFEECLACGEEWDMHRGHECCTGAIGVFEGCEENDDA